MTNLFAWASIGENGKATGGKKGDQTKKEVKVAPYYEFGQTWVIRFRSTSRGKKAGKAAKAMAENDNIGYNQNDRTSLFRECCKINWKIDKIHLIEKCNCDCSELAVCAVNFAYGYPKLASNNTTYSLPDTCKSFSKNFKRADKAIRTKKFKKGDLVGKRGHVIINV
jgi:hypothetical protein